MLPDKLGISLKTSSWQLYVCLGPSDVLGGDGWPTGPLRVIDKSKWRIRWPVATTCESRFNSNSSSFKSYPQLSSHRISYDTIFAENISHERWSNLKLNKSSSSLILPVSNLRFWSAETSHSASLCHCVLLDPELQINWCHLLFWSFTISHGSVPRAHIAGA